METKIVSITKNESDEDIIDKLSLAGEVIKNGGLVAFPTETVYGLGGDALNPESSKKIYAAKGRPSDNPLIIHIADMEHLEKIVSEVSEKTKKRTAELYTVTCIAPIFRKSIYNDLTLLLY